MSNKITTHNVYLARTGESREVEAATWQEAVRQTGRVDACVLERRDSLLGNSGTVIDATLNPDSPITIGCRVRPGLCTDAEHIQWALACVTNHLEALGVSK